MSLQFSIGGVGTSTPCHVVTQQDAADWASEVGAYSHRQRRIVSAMYRRTGIQFRHSALLKSTSNGHRAEQSFYPRATTSDDRGPSTATRMQSYEEHAPLLAFEAARGALDEAGIDARQITHLVTASCSGFSAPGVDIHLVRELGLPVTTQRTHVGFMGCHGAVNAIRVAKAFTDGCPNARVLLCAVELCTLHHRYGWEPKTIVSNSLFADGAAAIVGFRSSQDASWRVTSVGTTILPDSVDCMSWRIGNNGFEMELSPRVPDVVGRWLRPWLQQWLSGSGLTLDEIGSWAIHPGGPRVLEACAEAIGLAPEQLDASREILLMCGNMSSPTVLFILQRLRQREAPRPCVMLAFGPGMVAEAALIV